MNLQLPTKGNKKLEAIVNRVNGDTELATLWKSSNVMAIDRMGYNDHGPTHVKIVANISLKMLRLLVARERIPSIVKDHSMQQEDAEVVVVLGSLLHDIGHVVHRENHEQFAIPLAIPVIDRLLHGLYDKEALAVVRGEVLHCIISHTSGIAPHTLEAGVVKVADALDMEKGRARIPFHTGSVNIHSVSAMAVDKVQVRSGSEDPIEIEITMNNSAGIFQIDNLLRMRIDESRLSGDIKVIVLITGAEKKIIKNRIEI
jgi:metal-dependent HD superfamily phosphatase/phosphodiesterase